MEDLSRELEKELKAHSRPVQVKKKIRAELYFIDDYGKITPASWIRYLMAFMGLLIIVSTITSVIFVSLYTSRGGEEDLVLRLQIQEERIQKLISDKDILMARLVLSGKNPEAGTSLPTGEKNVDKVEKKKQEKAFDLKAEPITKTLPPAEPEIITIPEKVSPLLSPVKDEKQIVTAGNEKIKPLPEIIGIERLKVTRDGKKRDILVGFDIRNISVDLTTITGYVFVILKPDTLSGTNWLVLPKVKMDKDKPANYQKGQYFSIGHFKPVDFRVKTRLAHDSFKVATVFVYGDDGKLIYMKDIGLGESKG